MNNKTHEFLILILLAILSGLVLLKTVNSTINYSNSQYHEALQSYKNHNVTAKYIILVDFNKPSTSKRFTIIDKNTNQVVLETYVAHGKNSGELYATSFSNQSNSLKSSLGAYIVTGEYIGKHGKSLRIKGLDKGINDNAEKRAVVIHAADYAGKGGRSWGCFAIPPKDMNTLVNIYKSGVFLYAYHN